MFEKSFQRRSSDTVEGTGSSQPVRGSHSRRNSTPSADHKPLSLRLDEYPSICSVISMIDHAEPPPLQLSPVTCLPDKRSFGRSFPAPTPDSAPLASLGLSGAVSRRRSAAQTRISHHRALSQCRRIEQEFAEWFKPISDVSPMAASASTAELESPHSAPSIDHLDERTHCELSDQPEPPGTVSVQPTAISFLRSFNPARANRIKPLASLQLLGGLSPIAASPLCPSVVSVRRRDERFSFPVLSSLDAEQLKRVSDYERSSTNPLEAFAGPDESPEPTHSPRFDTAAVRSAGASCRQSADSFGRGAVITAKEESKQSTEADPSSPLPTLHSLPHDGGAAHLTPVDLAADSSLLRMLPDQEDPQVSSFVPVSSDPPDAHPAAPHSHLRVTAPTRSTCMARIPLSVAESRGTVRIHPVRLVPLCFLSSDNADAPSVSPADCASVFPADSHSDEQTAGERTAKIHMTSKSQT